MRPPMLLDGPMRRRLTHLSSDFISPPMKEMAKQSTFWVIRKLAICRPTFAFCRTVLSAERRSIGVGQRRVVRTLKRHTKPSSVRYRRIEQRISAPYKRQSIENKRGRSNRPAGAKRGELIQPELQRCQPR